VLYGFTVICNKLLCHAAACRDYTDISIAVATPKGLVVPVLRSVDKLSFAEVEKVRGL
jgi:pyruvate/2-oxoglutarate dehydrogenase complex dihydrolipoamide acyltransferase (E2) component